MARRRRPRRMRDRRPLRSTALRLLIWAALAVVALGFLAELARR